MSVQGSSLPATGLPPVNQALEPVWVRNGSAATKKAYDTALAFEQMLVEQLSKSMAATSGLGGGESSQEGESASGESESPMIGGQSSELSSMLPQALSAGVMNAGGLGLAAQMTRQLQDPSGLSPVSTEQGKSTAPSVGSTGGSVS